MICIWYHYDNKIATPLFDKRTDVLYNKKVNFSEWGAQNMNKFTEKEKSCLKEYVNDLLNLMKEEGVLTICDKKFSYNRTEIELMVEKIKSINEL